MNWKIENSSINRTVEVSSKYGNFEIPYLKGERKKEAQERVETILDRYNNIARLTEEFLSKPVICHNVQFSKGENLSIVYEDLRFRKNYVSLLSEANILVKNESFTLDPSMVSSDSFVLAEITFPGLEESIRLTEIESLPGLRVSFDRLAISVKKENDKRLIDALMRGKLKLKAREE